MDRGRTSLDYFEFYNSFLEHFHEKDLHSPGKFVNSNWFDIEEEYYNCLKDIPNKDIDSFNDGFNNIKQALADYLIAETTKE